MSVAVDLSTFTHSKSRLHWLFSLIYFGHISRHALDDIVKLVLSDIHSHSDRNCLFIYHPHNPPELTLPLTRWIFLNNAHTQKKLRLRSDLRSRPFSPETSLFVHYWRMSNLIAIVTRLPRAHNNNINDVDVSLSGRHILYYYYYCIIYVCFSRFSSQFPH